MDSSLSGPGCDDVEFSGNQLQHNRGYGKTNFDRLSKFEEQDIDDDYIGDDAWGDEDEYDDGYDSAREDVLVRRGGGGRHDVMYAGSDIGGGSDFIEAGDEIGASEEEGYYYDEPDDGVAPEWEDMEVHVTKTMIPSELAVKGEETLEWKLKDLYPSAFNCSANKGLKDNATLGGISVVTLKNPAPFTVAWYVSMPLEGSDKKKRSSLKSKMGTQSLYSSERIIGNKYLGENYKLPVHGTLAPNENLEMEIPCLSAPDIIAESFLSKHNMGHLTVKDMKNSSRVHRYEDAKGVIYVEEKHPIAKWMAERIECERDDRGIPLTESDFNKYANMLVKEHKQYMTLKDARENLSIHFFRYIPRDATKKSSESNSLASAWTSEVEVCNSISTTDPEQFKKAKDRLLNKPYNITGSILLQYAPKRN